MILTNPFLPSSHFLLNLSGKEHAFLEVRKRIQSCRIEASVVVLQSSETCKFDDAIHVEFS
jgi:hypothetical protein